MRNMRLRSRGLSPSSQRRTSSASSSTVTGAGGAGSSSRSQRRTARLESCPTSSQVQSRRNREESRGCPPAPHNSVDQSVIVLDDTLQENTLEEVFGVPAPVPGVSGGRPIPTFLEYPEPRSHISLRRQVRLPEYSEEDLAAHQSAINRALGLGLNVEILSPPSQQSPPEELIEIEDTTEEDTFEEEEEEEVTESQSQPSSQSPVSSPTESYRLELTIDLTDSPPVSQQVPPASPVTSQTSSLAQPSNPPSPALQCPVCLDSFSAIRSRGLQLVSTVCGHVFCRRCLRQCFLSQQQCPTCRRRIAHQDYHPLFL